MNQKRRNQGKKAELIRWVIHNGNYCMVYSAECDLDADRDKKAPSISGAQNTANLDRAAELIYQIYEVYPRSLDVEWEADYLGVDDEIVKRESDKSASTAVLDVKKYDWKRRAVRSDGESEMSSEDRGTGWLRNVGVFAQRGPTELEGEQWVVGKPFPEPFPFDEDVDL